MSHTPAPWLAIGSVPSDGVDCYFVQSEPTPGLRTKEIAAVNGPQHDDECASNARLIAAAPELLDALKELADMQRFAKGFSNGVEANGIEEADYWHGQTMERVLAAIKKAEGAA